MDDSGYEYNQANILGHGAFAIVYKGCYKKNPKKQVAIKVIEKKNLEKNPAILMKKEIKILQELQHENIVRLYDCRENDKKIFLVMEFCNS
jgi:serine/threonine protein kinase